MNNVIKKLLLAAFTLTFLLGCGLSSLIAEPTPTPTPTPGPTDAARAWIDAIVNQDGNQILKYTCRAQREAVQETSMWSSAFTVLAQMLTNRSVAVDGDVSDLKFEPVSAGADQAEVRVYGELRVAVLGSAQAHDVDERWQMIYENETWRWCGHSNIRAIPTNTPGSQTVQVPPEPSSTPTTDIIVASPTRNTESEAGDTLLQSQTASGIIFVSDRDEGLGFYSLDVDSLGVNILSTVLDINFNNFLFYGLSLSPNGQNILFVNGRTADRQIYKINLSTQETTQLTNSHTNFQPAWSPNGQQIAYVSAGENPSPNVPESEFVDIYVMNGNGSNKQRLTNIMGMEFCPRWSPDGTKLSFISMTDIVRSYVMDSDGSNATEIAKTRLPNLGNITPFFSLCSFFAPVWSPDSQQVVYSNPDPEQGTVNLFLYDLESRSERNLTNLVNQNETVTELIIPNWLTSDKIYVSGFSREREKNTYIVSPHDGSLLDFVKDIAITHEAFLSPDKQWIIFTSTFHPNSSSDTGNNPEIYSVNIDGTQLRRLTENPSQDIVLGVRE